MDNLQDTLTFPFRDKNSSSQFLIACAIMLAAFVIPILPAILLTGYTVTIMRQVIHEKKEPSMPSWQGSSWPDMFMDGLRLYGAQLVLMLPLVMMLFLGILLMIGGAAGFSALADEDLRSFGALGGVLFFAGIMLTLLFTLLSLPYGIIVPAALAHVAARGSFAAAFEFREWWPIFRRGLGRFVIVYVTILIVSFIAAFVIQLAMMTIVLICLVPFLMVPYSAYLVIVSNTFYAQAYVTGQADLQLS